MRLKVLNSNSDGNCYFFIADNGDTLIVECGVSFKRIKEALNYDLSKIVGVIVTHCHDDHCLAVPDLANAGKMIYTSTGTKVEIGKTYQSTNIKWINPQRPFTIGGFTIMAFDVKHDVPEPFGYLIQHKECGLTLFMTDTYYCPYKFFGLNNILIEANYCEDIINKRLLEGKKFLRDRVIQSHMSIQTCIGMLKANDLSGVNNIGLIHLSNNNSNAREFKSKVEAETGKNVFIATAGLTMKFDKTPY